MYLSDSKQRYIICLFTILNTGPVRPFFADRESWQPWYLYSSLVWMLFPGFFADISTCTLATSAATVLDERTPKHKNTPTQHGVFLKMWSPIIIPEIGRFQWCNNWSWGTPIIPEIPRKPSPRPGRWSYRTLSDFPQSSCEALKRSAAWKLRNLRPKGVDVRFLLAISILFQGWSQLTTTFNGLKTTTPMRYDR